MKKFTLIAASCLLAVSMAGCDGDSKAEFEGTWNYYYNDGEGKVASTITDETLEIKGKTVTRTMAGTYAGVVVYKIQSVDKETRQIEVFVESVNGYYLDNDLADLNTTDYLNYYVDGTFLYVSYSSNDTPVDALSSGRRYILQD